MKSKLVILVFLVFISSTYAQVGIGTDNPEVSSILDLNPSGNDKGLLIPRLSQGQRDAITSPANGLLIFQTDNTEGFYFYSSANSSWIKLSLAPEVNTNTQNITTNTASITANYNDKANLDGATFTGVLNSVASLTIGSSNGTNPSMLILNPNYQTNEGGEIQLKAPVSPIGNPDWSIDVYNEYLRLFPSAGGGMVSISKSGSVSAQKFVGDGSELTNLSQYLHAVMTTDENCTVGYKIGSGAGTWIVQSNRGITESALNGEFILTLGKTYSIQANLSLRDNAVSTAIVEFSIRNADNNILGSKGRCTGGSQFSSDTGASAIITPTTSNQCIISIKTDRETAATAYSGGFCSITITEIK